MNSRDPERGTAGAMASAEAHHREDLQLVRDALRGRSEARERLVPHLARVPAVVAKHRAQFRRNLQAHDEADLVQDCLALVWRKLPDYAGRAALSTWIWRLCSLELRNGFRRLQKGERGSSLPEGSEALTDERHDPTRQSLHLDLEAGLEHLSDEQQQIVRLRHFRGLSVEAAAEEMGLPVSQVKTLYYRSIRRLHEFLESRNWREDEA